MALNILHLPIGKGLAGFGLRPRSRVAPSAFIGSIVHAFPFFLDRLQQRHAQGADFSNLFAASPTGRNVQACLNQLGVAGIFAGGAPLADFPSQAAQLFTSECSQDAPTSKMQHLLTEACDVEAGKAFLIALPRNAETVALRAQMLSRSQKGTSSARLKMLLPDEAWEFYVRSVLHMPQCPGLGDLRCACGQALASEPFSLLPSWTSKGSYAQA